MTNERILAYVLSRVFVRFFSRPACYIAGERVSLRALRAAARCGLSSAATTAGARRRAWLAGSDMWIYESGRAAARFARNFRQPSHEFYV